MAKSFTNLGATIVDTVADLPTASASLEGLLYYQKDTNELKICDGSSWISMLDTDTPPGLTLLSTNAMGSVTNSVSNVFSSAYESYRIVINFANNSGAATRAVYLKFRTAGGDDSTAQYNYYMTYVYGSGTTGASGGASLTSASLCSTGSTFLGQSLILDIVGPNAVSNITSYTGSACTYQTDVGSYVFRTIGGTMNTFTQYTGFSIIGSTDVLNGTIRTYGYRNSI